LFSALPATVAPSTPSAVEEALAAINPDTLSPKEALETIYALKEKTQQKEKP
jgi:DNA mismatch repair protein MutS